MDYEESLCIKTAWYYYIENMTQQKISEKLGITRMRVIRLLEKARQDGIIQFQISQERSQHLQVEKRLIECFGLKDAFVIPNPPAESCLNESLAKAAAMYINDRLSENAYINMGYGDTPSRVLNHLATMAESPISVVSMTGGVSYYLPNNLSNVFNARLFLYPTPLMLSSEALCKAVREEPGVKEIARMVRLASMTILSVGGMGEDATIINNGILNKNDFLYLSMQGAVGDLLTHFIDINGNPVSSPIEDRLLSTPLDTLRDLNNVIVIAGGPNKRAAIRAALIGKYPDILITDEDTALALTQGHQG